MPGMVLSTNALARYIINPVNCQVDGLGDAFIHRPADAMQGANTWVAQVGEDYHQIDGQFTQHAAWLPCPVSVNNALGRIRGVVRAIAFILNPVPNRHSEERSDEESRSFNMQTRFFAPCGRSE
jgi:hypothetical protein